MTKYKVGDKVKVCKDLVIGEKYNTGLWFDEGMEKFKNKVLTITWASQNDSGEDRYNVKENGWCWSNDMLEPITKKTKTELEAEKFEAIIDRINERLESNTDTFKSVEKAIKEVSKSINNRTLYDDAVIEQVKEKVKSISIDDLKNEIHKDAEKYISRTFGIIPKKIEVVTDGFITKEMTGLFHNKFEDILKIVKKGVPLMLTGPAGAGKNHTLEQVAEALGLEFYFTNAITQEYKLTGFIDAGGKYQETQFYKAFKDGGLFFLDEVDASCPESLIVLNSAIANGYFDFPNGRVNAHKDFRVVCAGNTFGTGADMIYVGRNALDGATLDRFATIEFDYDEDIERQLAYDDELYNFIKALRKAIKESSLRYIVSMRATINASKLLEIGMDKKSILSSVIIKNMQIDDLNTIVNKINDSGEWFYCLKEVRDARG